MALPTTQKFEELVLETSPDGTTWARICGLIGVTVNRSAAIDEDEILDCDDEGLPMATIAAVRSITMTVSGTGKWAQSSHETLQDWFHGGLPRHARIGTLAAAVGDTEYESGMAILTALNNERQKGIAVTADVELRFTGAITRAAKVA